MTEPATPATLMTEQASAGPGRDEMSDQISPKFHAEIIVVLCDEFRDLRKVTDRVGILLSDASPEHIEAVGKYLPIDLMRVLPRRMPRAA
jgi:hypothetical protein